MQQPDENCKSANVPTSFTQEVNSVADFTQGFSLFFSEIVMTAFVTSVACTTYVQYLVHLKTFQLNQLLRVEHMAVLERRCWPYHD